MSLPRTVGQSLIPLYYTHLTYARFPRWEGPGK